jgi:hypothetical protein
MILRKERPTHWLATPGALGPAHRAKLEVVVIEARDSS